MQSRLFIYKDKKLIEKVTNFFSRMKKLLFPENKMVYIVFSKHPNSVWPSSGENPNPPPIYLDRSNRSYKLKNLYNIIL